MQPKRIQNWHNWQNICFIYKPRQEFQTFPKQFPSAMESLKISKRHFIANFSLKLNVINDNKKKYAEYFVFFTLCSEKSKFFPSSTIFHAVNYYIFLLFISLAFASTLLYYRNCRISIWKLFSVRHSFCVCIKKIVFLCFISYFYRESCIMYIAFQLWTEHMHINTVLNYTLIRYIQFLLFSTIFLMQQKVKLIFHFESQ